MPVPDCDYYPVVARGDDHDGAEGVDGLGRVGYLHGIERTTRLTWTRKDDRCNLHPSTTDHQPVMPGDVCPRTQSGPYEKPVAAARPAGSPHALRSTHLNSPSPRHPLPANR